MSIGANKVSMKKVNSLFKELPNSIQNHSKRTTEKLKIGVYAIQQYFPFLNYLLFIFELKNPKNKITMFKIHKINYINEN